jgi:hypothetical protein
MSGQLHAPAALLPGRALGTHCVGWVDPRAGLGNMQSKEMCKLGSTSVHCMGARSASLRMRETRPR